MSRALLYSREGLFSLKGGSGLREGDLLFHKEPSPIEASAICCLPPAWSSPFSPSAPFYCKPAANKDKSTMNSSAPGRHCPLQLCKPSLLFSCTLPSLSEHSISPPSLSNSVFCVKKKKPWRPVFFLNYPFTSRSLLMCIFQLLPTLSPGVKWRIQEVRGLTNRVPNKRPLYRADEWESVLQGIHPSTTNSIPCPFLPCEINTDMRQERGEQSLTQGVL